MSAVMDEQIEPGEVACFLNAKKQLVTHHVLGFDHSRTMEDANSFNVMLRSRKTWERCCFAVFLRGPDAPT
jgi:hypothetical protein